MQQLIEVKNGDIVHLNSGSPDLKVVGQLDNQLEVEWLGDSGSLERLTLPAVCFKRSVRESPARN